MSTSWNYGVVALSVITAIIGSYIALYLAGRLRLATGRARMLYTLSGAFIMGLAIWSMHFVGMLAMTMDMPMSYDPFLSFLSMVAAAVGAGIAFLILQRPAIGRIHYIFGSLAMGLAISTMHYTGMASMQMAAKIVYNPPLFALSILIAIVASAGALWLAFLPPGGTTKSLLVRKVGSAVVMGIAISGMHYTGMAAAHYLHTGTLAVEATRPTVGGYYLGDLMIGALVIFGVALITLSAHAFAERQKTIEALRESEQRFMATFEQAAVGIGHVGANGELLRMNQKYCDILGYTHEELMGMTFQQVTYLDDLTLDLQLYEQLKTRQIPSYTIEKRYIRKDGTLVWVNLTVSVVWKENGDIDYAIAVVEDITDKKKVEEALKASQAQLAESNKDLEHFATIASHDLQAPLRKVRIFSEQLEQELAGKLNDEARDIFRRIQESIAHMQEMITDVLALSKVSRKAQAFERVDLSKVIKKVLYNLDEQIKEKDALIEVEELSTIFGDEVQIEQLLQNLLSNSLKYQSGTHRPVVRINARCPEQHFCEITIADNGIGFDPKYIDRIFEPFERLHGKSSQYQGTGVGLAICKRIVERHGGSIEVRSEEGKGSVFTIWLPHHPNQARRDRDKIGLS